MLQDETDAVSDRPHGGSGPIGIRRTDPITTCLSLKRCPAFHRGRGCLSHCPAHRWFRNHLPFLVVFLKCGRHLCLGIDASDAFYRVIANCLQPPADTTHARFDNGQHEGYRSGRIKSITAFSKHPLSHLLCERMCTRDHPQGRRVEFPLGEDMPGSCKARMMNMRARI